MKKKATRVRTHPDASMIRAEAKQLLRESGTRLLLLEAILVAAFPLMVFFLSSSVVYYVLPTVGETLVPWVELGGDAILFFFCLFFLLPLWVGLLHIASQIERGEDAVLSDLFWAFGSGRAYRTALSLSFGALWRLLVTAFVVKGTYALFGLWVNSLTVGRIPVAMLGGFGIVLEVLLALFLSASAFPFAWGRLSQEGSPQLSRRFRSRMRAGAGFYAGYFPAFLLSIFSVGVLLPADLLPKLLLAYFRYCRRWNELTIQSEENKYE